jgi:lipopolysaccharide biosynthesis protein
MPDPLGGAPLNCRRSEVDTYTMPQYGEQARAELEPLSRRLRSVAFYLPQFHPIPENDEWWGPGFTEWTNVVKGRPRFPGHHQPHLPADLGFYDLRLPDTREAQAKLARDNGVDAFCYYHYWFGGRRLLERPFDEVLESGSPDLPFLLCWANENWTRRWDGLESSVLVRQSYDEADDHRHGKWLARAFADERYLRLDSKPVFLVYSASSMDDPRRTTRIWRDEARRAGVGEIFLARVESNRREHTDPTVLGFDAAVEFAPDWTALPKGWRRIAREVAHRAKVVDSPLVHHHVHEYEAVARRMLAKPDPSYVRFPCVTPGWDNTARRDRGAVILNNASPEAYGRWLAEAARRAPAPAGADSLVFVNAWNEWGEGCHLEPCQRWGHGFLDAHRETMDAANRARAASAVR